MKFGEHGALFSTENLRHKTSEFHPLRKREASEELFRLLFQGFIFAVFKHGFMQ